jgi:2,4-dienoyl-CoA reductase-like NADH-dependent reductase (Old Yellow Enzyme family)/NADPH-dependent glutamate synthase beta subunit-like oxidoreductase
MYKYLFEPIKLGSVELKNRIAFTSIGIDSYNSQGTVTDENISFVKARSVETGMIITTVSMATYKYGRVKFIGSYDDFFIPSLSRFAAAGHSNGAKILLQISAMGGPNTLADDVFHEIIPYVPSANIIDYKENWAGKNIPTELTAEQIEEIIDDFIQASRRAREAGFDGVELFAAEDFLLASFMTPHFNKRSDKYGGDFEKRLRIHIEIIRGIKKICGDDFIIGFKYNTYYEFPEGDGIDLENGVRIGKRLAEEKISYLHEYSYAKHDKPFSLFKYSIMASQYQPRNSTIPISEKLKEEIKDIPIMAVGSILKPAEADMIIREGKADLVSIGRAFIADPLWAFKARSFGNGHHKNNSNFNGLSSKLKSNGAISGSIRPNESLEYLSDNGCDNIVIRPCIRCFVCLDEATKSRIIGCSVNPDVLAEESKSLKPSADPKKVMIIGAGPAGMVCALTASKRGHHVTLFEKDKNIGGQLITNSVKGLKYEYADLLEYYRIQIAQSNIILKNGTVVTSDIVKSENPDILVIAIGPKSRDLEIPVIYNSSNGLVKEHDIVIDAAEAIKGAKGIKNKKIAVIGGTDFGCEAAILLNRYGNHVTIFEEDEELMMNNDIKYLTMVMERIIVEEEIRFFLKFKVLKFENDKLLVENTINHNTFEVDCNIIVNARGFEVPEDELRELSSLAVKTFVIGDCLKPAKIFQAVSAGFDIGAKL